MAMSHGNELTYISKIIVSFNVYSIFHVSNVLTIFSSIFVISEAYKFHHVYAFSSFTPFRVQDQERMSIIRWRQRLWQMWEGQMCVWSLFFFTLI